MDFTRTGIILNTEKYRECVNFYGRTLGLPRLYEIDRPGERLTCFDMGGVYLMVEPGGHAHADAKPVDRCPTKVRFSVADIDAACSVLRARGVDVEVRRHDRGTTAAFRDPDGNRRALGSDAGFGP